MIVMNKNINLTKALFLIYVIAILLFFCSDCFAIEGPSKGRKIWDLVMLWVNFGILVFFFMKFAKEPLMNFLRGESKKIGEKLDSIDRLVKNAKSLMEVEANKLEDIDSHMKVMNEQITALGQMEKSTIIENAETTAKKMIEDARQEAEYKLEMAKKKFSLEMLDAATSIAVELLKEKISQEDNEKIIDQFLTGLYSQKGLFA